MFTSVNYEKYMYMCIPFLVVFCTCHKTVKVSDDDIDQVGVYVVVQFCPWFKFYFLLFLGMVIYDNEFETKENKI